MITRYDSLEQALAKIEARELSGAALIVVSRRWWSELSAKEQEAYRRRAERAGVELRADDAISAHFVEVRGAGDGPPLSTEQSM
jgi:hypothetical protein